MSAKPVTLRIISLIGLLKKSAGDIAFEGQPVKVRRIKNAKRLVLRVDSVTAEIKLTCPPHVGARELEKFISENRAWLKTEQGKLEARPLIGDGTDIMLRGETHQVLFSGIGPRGVVVEDSVITVGGPTEQSAARLERWFKSEAKSVITEDANEFADLLEVSFKRVSIGDMKSRWGSCSSSGTLRFNWRLLMAPENIRRYVAAHEVAHLLEMNHSERFWHHVGAVMPGYMRHRRWLKEQGHDLMQVRFR